MLIQRWKGLLEGGGTLRKDSLRKGYKEEGRMKEVRKYVLSLCRYRRLLQHSAKDRLAFR